MSCGDFNQNYTLSRNMTSSSTLGGWTPTGELDWNYTSTNRSVMQGSLATNLVAYYKFDNNFADSTGNHAAAAMVGSVTNAGGKVNGSVKLPGSGSNYLTVSTSGYPSGNSSFTICSWLYFTNVSAQNDFFGSGANNQFMLNVNNFQVNGPFNFTTNVGANNNEWTHACFVYSATDGNDYFYKNGVLAAWQPQGVVNFTDSGTGVIGINPQLNNGRFNGKIDEQAVWTRALSASEISQLFNIQKGTWKDNNLVAYYKFNDTNASGTIAYDYASGNDGTLVGGGGDQCISRDVGHECVEFEWNYASCVYCRLYFFKANKCAHSKCLDKRR